MKCVVYQLGLIKYAEAYRLQNQLLEERFAGRIADTLLLLEHPPTITVGKSGKLENVLASPAQLAEKGVSLIFIDRGGDATYHGPGQIVGYPIFDLRERGKNVHQYVHELEEVLIRTLNDFSIESVRDRKHPGVWVENQEIAALGLRLKKWITMHGFALNVNTDLSYFSLINPCGFSDRKATSMSHLLDREIPVPAVTERLLAHISEVFNLDIEIGMDRLLTSDYERKTTSLV